MPGSDPESQGAAGSESGSGGVLLADETYQSRLAAMDPMEAPDAGGFTHGQALIPLLLAIYAELKGIRGAFDDMNSNSNSDLHAESATEELEVDLR